MNYNRTTNCAGGGNTGMQKCTGSLGGVKGFVLVPAGTEIDTKANAELLATWTAGINAVKADRWFPFPIAFKVEDVSTEEKWVEGSFGQRDMVERGAYALKMTLPRMGKYNEQQLQLHNNKTDLGVFLIKSDGAIEGYSSDGVKFQAIDLSEFYISKPTLAVGEDASRLMVNLEFANTEQYAQYGVAIKPTTFNPLSQLLGIMDVMLEATLPTATSVKITVTNYADGGAVVGLVAGDFVMTDDGAAVTLTTVTDNSDGTYSVVNPTVGGVIDVNLKQQPAMATAGFESIGSVTYTI